MTFELAERDNGWTFTDSQGASFLSIGLNHADESSLKYPHNLMTWGEKYGSREAWISNGVVADMRDWGFNTIGWTQEYIAGGWGEALDWFGDPIDLQHSATQWSAGELRSTGVPYVVQLPVQEIQDWNGKPHFRDVFDEEFQMWCAYLARTFVLDHRDSNDLLGYFFVDIPAWLPHAGGDDFPQLLGLSEKQRDAKLYDIAQRYYSIITAAIRHLDPDHLILGDRYNGNKGIPEPVLRAMGEHVDVLSVQYFTDPNDESRRQMRDDFARWHEICGRPVLNADLGNWIPTQMNPNRTSEIADQRGRGTDYAESLRPLLDEPWFLGWHWCGYVENLGRGWGLKDPYDEPYTDFVDGVRRFNAEATEQWRTASPLRESE